MRWLNEPPPARLVPSSRRICLRRKPPAATPSLQEPVNRLQRTPRTPPVLTNPPPSCCPPLRTRRLPTWCSRLRPERAKHSRSPIGSCGCSCAESLPIRSSRARLRAREPARSSTGSSPGWGLPPDRIPKLPNWRASWNCRSLGPRRPSCCERWWIVSQHCKLAPSTDFSTALPALSALNSDFRPTGPSSIHCGPAWCMSKLSKQFWATRRRLNCR
jgi:hypothetical protein